MRCTRRNTTILFVSICTILFSCRGNFLLLLAIFRNISKIGKNKNVKTNTYISLKILIPFSIFNSITNTWYRTLQHEHLHNTLIYCSREHQKLFSRHMDIIWLLIMAWVYEVPPSASTNTDSLYFHSAADIFYSHIKLSCLWNQSEICLHAKDFYECRHNKSMSQITCKISWFPFTLLIRSQSAIFERAPWCLQFKDNIRTNRICLSDFIIFYHYQS